MKTMIVITCKNSNINYITNCVKSIRNSGNKDIICVIDSGSTDKSYFNQIIEYDVIIEDINNQNYIDGAIWYCYEKYTDIDYFFILHDSMVVNENLTPITNYDFTVFSYFEGLPFDSEQQLKYCIDMVNSVNLDINNIQLNTLAGLFGTSFYCKRKILDDLKKLGLNRILPKNKLEACASERIWAIFLHKLGIDIRLNYLRTFINQNTEFDNKTNYITKIFAGRS